MSKKKEDALKTFDKFLESCDYGEFKVYSEEEEEAVEAAPVAEDGLITLPVENVPVDPATPVVVEQPGEPVFAPGGDGVTMSVPGALPAAPPAIPVAQPTTSYKVVVLSAIDESGEEKPHGVAATEALSEKLTGAEVKHVKLFQLSIQPAARRYSESEPQDGMAMVYEALTGADALVLSTEIAHERIPAQLNDVIDRLQAHYRRDELRNVVFATVLSGDCFSEDEMHNALIGKFLPLGILTSKDCHMFCGWDGDADSVREYDPLTSTLAAALKPIAEATKSLRNESVGVQAPDPYAAPAAPATSEEDLVVPQTFDTFAAQQTPAALPPALPAAEPQPVDPADAPQPASVVEVEEGEEPATEEEEIYTPMLFNDFERSRIPGYIPEVPGVVMVTKKPQ